MSRLGARDGSGYSKCSYGGSDGGGVKLDPYYYHEIIIKILGLSFGTRKSLITSSFTIRKPNSKISCL